MSQLRGLGSWFDPNTTPVPVHRPSEFLPPVVGYPLDADFEEVRRLFHPRIDPGCTSVPSDQLVVYNPTKQISQLQHKNRASPAPVRSERSMVVCIDSAGIGKDTKRPQFSYGVYFGPASPYNTAKILSPSLPQSDVRATIEALADALEIIRRICGADFKLTNTKIASDSEFLVNAISQWIGPWIEDDGIGEDGQQVEHFDRLKEINELLDDMEYGDDGGIEVALWHVPRALQGEAHRLASRNWRTRDLET